MSDQNFWRKCIVCKKEIGFTTKYYKCSVSSCDKKRSPAQFCSVECWDVHRSIMSHKSAGADEYQSPSKGEWEQESQNESKVRLVSTSSSKNHELNAANVDDVLVVVSKMKAYIKERSEFNTSGDVNSILSDIIRNECDKAIVNARMDNRKTVMARDFK